MAELISGTRMGELGFGFSVAGTIHLLMDNLSSHNA